MELNESGTYSHLFNFRSEKSSLCGLASVLPAYTFQQSSQTKVYNAQIIGLKHEESSGKIYVGINIYGTAVKLNGFFVQSDETFLIADIFQLLYGSCYGTHGRWKAINQKIDQKYGL